MSLLDTSKIIKFCLSVCLKSPKRLSFCFCSFINNSLHIKLLNLADYTFTGIDGCKAPSYLSDDHDHSLTPGSNGFLKRKDILGLLDVTKRLFQDLVTIIGVCGLYCSTHRQWPRRGRSLASCLSWEGSWWARACPPCSPGYGQTSTPRYGSTGPENKFKFTLNQPVLFSNLHPDPGVLITLRPRLLSILCTFSSSGVWGPTLYVFQSGTGGKAPPPPILSSDSLICYLK